MSAKEVEDLTAKVEKTNEKVEKMSAQLDDIRAHIFKFLDAYGNHQQKMGEDMKGIKAALGNVASELCKVAKG